MNPPLITFLALLLSVLTPKATTDEATYPGNNQVNGIIGAILNHRSRIGKEQRVAVEDFNASRNQSLVLHIRNSCREPVHAALAGT